MSNADEENDHDFVSVGESKKRMQRKADDIAVEWPIVAETDPRQKLLVGLWRTEAWDFDNQCIGDFGLSKNKSAIRKNHHWWDRFEGVGSKDELQKRIFEPGERDLRLPCLPPMTFNRFDPRAFTPTLGATVVDGEPGVIGVVRFVCHLDEAEAVSLQFNNNFQMILDDTDTFVSVTEAINAELKDDAGTRSLFNKLKDSWKLQLWVMPHEPVPQKLFRLGQSSPTGDLLMNFISQHVLEAVHRKLYMEAHLWPVSDEDHAHMQQHDVSIPKAKADKVSGGSDEADGDAVTRARRSRRRPGTKSQQTGEGARFGKGHAGKSTDLDHSNGDSVDAADVNGGKSTDEQMQDVLEQSRQLHEEQEMEQAMQTSREEYDRQLKQTIEDSGRAVSTPPADLNVQ